MSESTQAVQKPERTLGQIQAEFTKVCAQAGQAQYQIQILQGDLNNYNKLIRELNIEASQLKSKLDAEAAAEASNVTELKKEA